MTRSLEESLAGGSPVQWAIDFLNRGGFPVTGPNVQVVYSWELAESSGGGGMWNPLNTTQQGYPGETPFNDNGGFPVMNYARRDDGLDANAKVIRNGHYPAVVASLMMGTDAAHTALEISASVWGTGHIVLQDPPGDVPAPAPKPPEDEMQVIALPQRATPNGRSALAVWDPAHPNRIALENGGRLKGDSTTAPPSEVRFWTPRQDDGSNAIPPGVHGIGISPELGHLGKIVAVVLACTGANTYRAELP